MVLIFYPHEDNTQSVVYEERIAILLSAAENYKAAVLEIKPGSNQDSERRSSPSEIEHAYNWPEIATVLQEVRELPEGNDTDKNKKAELLTKLAEVYEVLRGAKMAKLEAIRMALINEARQLGGGSAAGIKA